MVVAFGSRVRPITVSPVTLLPDPDSPTIPSVRPRARSSDTPSTACTIPSRVRNVTRRSRISSTGATSVPRAESRNAYRMSTIRFATMMNTAPKSTVPWIAGRSELMIASYANRPTPGMLNTVSVRTAPPSRIPMSRPASGDRRQRGAQPVAEHDATLRQPLRAGGADVVLAENLDQVPAHHPRVEGRERRRAQNHGRTSELNHCRGFCVSGT